MFQLQPEAPASIRQNSSWLLLARLSAQALAVLFTAITARRLGLDDFGHFAWIASILLIGNTVTNFGTDIFLVREVAKERQVTALGAQSLSLQLVLSAVFWLVLALYRDSALLLYAFVLLPLALFSVNNALLRGLGRMDLFWLLGLFAGAVQVSAAYFSSDLWSLCLYLLAVQSVLAVTSIWICAKSLPAFSLLPLRDFRPILRMLLPFAVLSIVLVLMQRLGILSVSAILGDSATGLFSSSIRVVDGLKFGHYAILGALLPALSRGTPDAWQSFRRAFMVLTIASATFAVALLAFSGPVMIVLYGRAFLPAAHQLALLGWTLLPYTFSSFISYALIARGLEYTLVKAAILSLIVNSALYVSLIVTRGLSGAIWAAVTGECVQAIIFGLYYFRRDRASRPAQTE